MSYETSAKPQNPGAPVDLTEIIPYADAGIERDRYYGGSYVDPNYTETTVAADTAVENAERITQVRKVAPPAGVIAVNEPAWPYLTNDPLVVN